MSPDLTNLPLNEADTRSKPIKPAVYARGWTEEHMHREKNTVHKKTGDNV